MPEFRSPRAETWPFSASLQHLDLGHSGRVCPELSPAFGKVQQRPSSGKGCTRVPSSMLERIAELRELRHFSGRLADEVTRLPESMSLLVKLENLDIWGEKLGSLFPGIGSCRQLRQLAIETSQELILPASITQLSKLSLLRLIAEQGARAPPGMAALTSLVAMELNFCLRPGAWRFPQGAQTVFADVEVTSFFPIPSLQRLQTTVPPFNSEMAPHTSLQHLALLGGSRGRFTVLKYADKHLPECLWSLQNLRTLFLERLHDLQFIPEAIRGLSCLEELGVEECCNIQNLPDSLARLPRLKKFVVKNAPRITSWPWGPWPSLETLHLEGMSELELPEGLLRRFYKLKVFRLKDVEKVEELQTRIFFRCQGEECVLADGFQDPAMVPGPLGSA